MSLFTRRALLPFLVIPVAVPCGAITLAAGTNDGFLLPADTVAPGAALVTVLGQYGGVQAYDLVAGVNGANDRQVAHTFTGLAGVTSATLTIRVRAGQVAGVENDGIFFSFVESPTDSYAEKIAWRRTFGPVPETQPWYPEDDPGLVASSWHADAEALIILDLGALPMPDGSTLDLLPQVFAKGFLDVNVSDDTAVDYAFLQVELTSTDAPLVSAGAADLRAFPNPFRASTALHFSIPQAGPATLAIYDVTGRPVRTDWRVDWGPGENTVRWDGRDDRGRQVASGVYWVRLSTPQSAEAVRVVHLR